MQAVLKICQLTHLYVFLKFCSALLRICEEIVCLECPLTFVAKISCYITCLPQSDHKIAGCVDKSWKTKGSVLAGGQK